MTPVRAERRSQESASQGLAQNMSAPPRSTISFRPYGIDPDDTGAARPASGQGLRWLLRADPDALLLAHLPEVRQRMTALNRQALAFSKAGDTPASQKLLARVSCLRLGGLVLLAEQRVVRTSATDFAPLEEQPAEVLLDRLTDLAARFTHPPAWLPALGIVEPVESMKKDAHPDSTDVLACLWLLTHLNGRTFDRDGPSLLASGLAENQAYDLYTR